MTLVFAAACHALFGDGDVAYLCVSARRRVVVSRLFSFYVHTKSENNPKTQLRAEWEHMRGTQPQDVRKWGFLPSPDWSRLELKLGLLTACPLPDTHSDSQPNNKPPQM